MYSQMDQGTTISTSTIDAAGAVPLRKNRRSRYIYSTYTPNYRFSRYNNTLRGLIPIRFKKSNNELSVQNSGFFSFITFHWILKYLQETFSNKIGPRIPICPKPDSCRVNSARLNGLFSNQTVKQGQNNLSILRVIWNFIRTRMIFACILYIMASLTSMIGLVFFLPKIFKSENGQWEFIIGLVFTELISYILHSASSAINLRTAIRLRSACFSLLYKQAMFTSLTHNISSWQLVSFLLSDGQNIHNFVMAIPELICTPIIVLLCMLFSGFYLNLWGYIAVLIIYGFFPIFILFAILSKNVLNKATFYSDQRIKLLEEFITHNFNVKLYKLENWFKKHISVIRKNEVKNITKAGFYDNLCFSFILLQPLLSLVCLYVAYTSEENIPLFAAISVLLLIHMKQCLDNFWNGLNNFFKGVAAFNKLKQLMIYDTVNLGFKKPKERNLAIYIEDASFQWTKELTLNINKSKINMYLQASYEDENINIPTSISYENNILHDINISVEHGKLIGICGLPGSGRSSLLLAVMGLLMKSKGKQFSVGHFSYISENTTIFNDSIKYNILFGNELDTQRYYKVTMFCELQEFISKLSEQDDTIIDSKSLTLEQKQCIILARALYEDGNIYLLDDPLSALEYGKSMRLFDNCLKKSLQYRTILLVTNQTKFLEQCDEIYMLRDGKIVLQGPHQYLLENENEYFEFINYLHKQKTVCKDKSNMFEIENDIHSVSPKKLQHSKLSNYNLLNSMESLNNIDGENIGNDTTDSKQETKHEFGSIAGLYFSHFGNCCSLTFLFLAQILNATLIAFLPIYFIYSLMNKNHGNASLIYLLTYLVLFITMLILGIIMNFYFNKTTFSASKLFHNDIMRKLYRASLSFFQSKSFGIISTISVQLLLTDNEIPYLIQNIFLNLFIAIMTIVIIIYTFYYNLVSVFVVILLISLVTVYVRKTLLNFNKSGMSYIDELYTEVLVMLKSRSLIQANNKIDLFSKRLYDTYDEYMVHLYIMHAAKYWHRLVIHCCTVLLLTSIALMLIYLDPTCDQVLPISFLNSDMCKALAIISTIQICFVLQQVFNLYLNLGLNFDVLAQVYDFKMSITDESHNFEDDEDYKDFGLISYNIKFSNVTLDLEKTFLSSMSFRIREYEKMGFIGLTSIEKQAIIAILYRLSNVTSGNVTIGVKKISDIPLKYLRSLVSVVTSEPYLFNYSITNFLNINNDFPETLVQVLNKFMLLDRINSLPNKTDSIADKVLNTEEKQILCLAQAYVKQSPIILIEEFVNGSILEFIIGSKIKTLFPQSTMLIFANDINGLQDCDNILFMNKGKIEFAGDYEKMYTIVSQLMETSL